MREGADIRAELDVGGTLIPTVAAEFVAMAERIRTLEAQLDKITRIAPFIVRAALSTETPEGPHE